MGSSCCCPTTAAAALVLSASFWAPAPASAPACFHVLDASPPTLLAAVVAALVVVFQAVLVVLPAVDALLPALFHASDAARPDPPPNDGSALRHHRTCTPTAAVSRRCGGRAVWPTLDAVRGAPPPGASTAMSAAAASSGTTNRFMVAAPGDGAIGDGAQDGAVSHATPSLAASLNIFSVTRLNRPLPQPSPAPANALARALGQPPRRPRTAPNAAAARSTAALAAATARDERERGQLRRHVS
jgi:hypothetical protein